MHHAQASVLENLEEGEVLNVDDIVIPKSTLVSANNNNNKKTSTLISSNNTDSSVNNDKRYKNSDSNFKRLFYSLDCEVEHGHDNPGEQKLIDTSKNVKKRALKKIHLD